MFTSWVFWFFLVRLFRRSIAKQRRGQDRRQGSQSTPVNRRSWTPFPRSPDLPRPVTHAVATPVQEMAVNAQKKTPQNSTLYRACCYVLPGPHPAISSNSHKSQVAGSSSPILVCSLLLEKEVTEKVNGVEEWTFLAVGREEKKKNIGQPASQSRSSAARQGSAKPWGSFLEGDSKRDAVRKWLPHHQVTMMRWLDGRLVNFFCGRNESSAPSAEEVMVSKTAVQDKDQNWWEIFLQKLYFISDESIWWKLKPWWLYVTACVNAGLLEVSHQRNF